MRDYKPIGWLPDMEDMDGMDGWMDGWKGEQLECTCLLISIST